MRMLRQEHFRVVVCVVKALGCSHSAQSKERSGPCLGWEGLALSSGSGFLLSVSARLELWATMIKRLPKGSRN